MTTIRTTVLALTAVATVFGSIATAEAGHRHKHKHFKGHGHHKVYHGYKKHCFWTKKKVFVGRDYHGHKIFKFRKVKICR